tara:strand:+ start:2400 stop:2768 length:369 start_codon:yes stop_codon:yes gene_type:complete
MGYVLIKAPVAAVPFVAAAGSRFIPMVLGQGGKHVVGGAARTVGGGAMTRTAASSVPAVGKVGVAASSAGAGAGMGYGVGREMPQINSEKQPDDNAARYDQLATETRQMLRDKASTNPTQFS